MQIIQKCCFYAYTAYAMMRSLTEFMEWCFNDSEFLTFTLFGFVSKWFFFPSCTISTVNTWIFKEVFVHPPTVERKIILHTISINHVHNFEEEKKTNNNNANLISARLHYLYEMAENKISEYLWINEPSTVFIKDPRRECGKLHGIKKVSCV